MRTIKYQRYEFHQEEPEDREAPLSVIVYDVPYFGACGIFPPFHITNQFFASGGSRGGMSPGATWEPFTITEAEYLELVSVIENLTPETLGAAARYKCKFEFDCSFDNLNDLEAWVEAVCDKHRAAYREKAALLNR